MIIPRRRAFTHRRRALVDLKKMFVYAPDTAIGTHPIRFGSGEWTAVTGVMTGTFTDNQTYMQQLGLAK